VYIKHSEKFLSAYGRHLRSVNIPPIAKRMDLTSSLLKRGKKVCLLIGVRSVSLSKRR